MTKSPEFEQTKINSPWKTVKSGLHFTPWLYTHISRHHSLDVLITSVDNLIAKAGADRAMLLMTHGEGQFPFELLAVRRPIPTKTRNLPIIPAFATTSRPKAASKTFSQGNSNINAIRVHMTKPRCNRSNMDPLCWVPIDGCIVVAAMAKLWKSLQGSSWDPVDLNENPENYFPSPVDECKDTDVNNSIVPPAPKKHAF